MEELLVREFFKDFGEWLLIFGELLLIFVVWLLKKILFGICFIVFCYFLFNEPALVLFFVFIVVIAFMD